MNHCLNLTAFFLVAVAVSPMLADDHEHKDDDHGHEHHEHVHATIERNKAIRQALIAWRNTLGPDLVKKATFAFDSKERQDWHFFPRNRPGVSFRDMNLEQRKAAHALLRSALSDQGYFKSILIMSLDDDLRRIEAGRENVNEIRDSEKYYFTIYGDPAEKTKPWGWKVEGHHLSLNFSSVDGDMASVTPAFFGANPAEIRVGPKAGMRVMGDEEDFARALVKSLDAGQRKKAIIAEQAPRDIILSPGKAIKVDAPHGIAASDLNIEQKKMLRDLVYTMTGNFNDELRDKASAEIHEAGPDKLFFAWAGGLEKGEGHYFRIHGPSLIIEYDNVQGNANHIHMVWHSPNNNFGLDALKKHYETAEHHQKDVE